MFKLQQNQRGRGDRETGETGETGCPAHPADTGTVKTNFHRLVPKLAIMYLGGEPGGDYSEIHLLIRFRASFAQLYDKLKGSSGMELTPGVAHTRLGQLH